MRLVVRAAALLGVLSVSLLARGADGNRLNYLDESDPFYPSRAFPKLITPQWVGEGGVEAVVVLAIDDLQEKKPGDHERWRNFLQPMIERLKRIDGRAPISIMTVKMDPRHPQFQAWLKDGLSLEVHTLDHPCPLLNGGDFAKAKATYDRCVEQMNDIPGNLAVAFRTPCCDSMNTPSPRLFAEIFNGRTPAGQFLSIDSSVCNLITADDPQLPRELVLDRKFNEIFRRYLPFKSFVTTIEDYPYPYVIGRLCWEFPCVVPSDWSAQHVQKPDNPQTVEDFRRAIDAAVIKQGVATLIFHPHKWIKPEQMVELIDHAVVKHGKKVKFLNFREAQERLDKHLLGGQPLRAGDGGDNGVRLLDINCDGFQDVVIGNSTVQKFRTWSPMDRQWIEGEFPAKLVESDATGKPRDAGARFGVLAADGLPSVVVHSETQKGCWHFANGKWMPDARFGRLTVGAQEVLTSRQGRDTGVRLRDLDGDGICELLVSNPSQQAVFAFDAVNGWTALDWVLPAGVTIVDAAGRDAGLRFVDIDEDGCDDLIFSNDERYSAHRFESTTKGWDTLLVAGSRGDAGAIPPIVRAGTNNGVWFKNRSMWVQNEDTDKLPDVVDRLPLDNLLTNIKFPGPKSPRQSLAVTHARPGMRVELAATEPLVADPIAMAWGPDGKFWVVEMGDYPRGVDGKGKHGGVVRYLEDTDHDGRYDKSTVFLDDLSFPNGIAPWRKGVIITAAPDIVYAEDTDGDGRADKQEVLYRGFTPSNPQHRVNGLKWGVDGWLYGAHGDAIGGKVKLMKTGEFVAANGRDFRIQPDTGALDPQAGPSQYGRNPDDWDNWFGNTNSDPMFQFVLDDHYLRRNPHVAAADGRVDVPEQAGAAEVFPRSRTIARFNDLYAANRFTSANSTIVYRDDLFGPAFEGNAFVSEPVHNLVHREVLHREGLVFRGQRADGEKDSEFLASADNWFRPTALATGPDGALWVADMYRQTIEHPEWIPTEIQKQLDLRAGSDMGRIYRVYPIGATPRPIPRLDKLSTAELVAALDSPSGWQRDMVQQLLMWRNDQQAAEPLRALVQNCQRPTARMQALWSLEHLGGLDAESILRGLTDPHQGVRRQAVRLAERYLDKFPPLGERLFEMGSDSDVQVQLQRAYTLGEWHDARAGKALGELAVRYADNRFIVAAVLSSAKAENLATLLATVLDVPAGGEPPAELLEQLVRLASALEDDATLGTALKQIGKSIDGRYAPWQLSALAGLLDALDRREADWEKYDTEQHLARMMTHARASAASEQAGLEDRLRCMRLLGRGRNGRGADLQVLSGLLSPGVPAELQSAAVAALSRIDANEASAALVSKWKDYLPSLRGEVLDALLSRTSWCKKLLAAIEANEIAAADVDASRRQRLLNADDAEVKELAKKLLASEVAANRAQVVDDHQAVLTMTGDAAAGGAVFVKRCAVCHRLRGVGHEVGPNLASLTDYSPQALLVALLDPNRAVEAKYLEYIAVTSAGLTYTGSLANETGNSVTLLQQEGKQQTILRSDLEELRASGKSLMPEGLEKDLGPQDLANVIAYLRESGSPRKKFYANNPRVVTPTTDGTLQLYATSCEIYGPTIVLERLYKNLAKWESENDRVVWNVEVAKPGRYVLLLNYAVLDADAGNRWRLEVGDQSLEGVVVGTGSLDQYQEIRGGEIELPAGSQQIVFRSAGPVKGNLLNLGGIQLKPVPKAK